MNDASFLEEWDADYDPELFDDAGDDCDHSDADITWDGVLECTCGHRQYLTSEEISAYYDQMFRYHAELDAMYGDPWWARAWRRLSDIYFTIALTIKRRLNPKRASADDDIPF